MSHNRGAGSAAPGDECQAAVMAPGAPGAASTANKVSNPVTTQYISADIADALRRICKAVDLEYGCQPREIAGQVELLRAHFSAVSGHMQACAQKYALGLGGEQLHQLLVLHVDELRERLRLLATWAEISVSHIPPHTNPDVDMLRSGITESRAVLEPGHVPAGY